MGGGWIESDFFLARDELEMLRDQVRRDTMKIEALAPAQNRRQNFLGLGRRKNELHVRGRFFERLEERIERSRTQHVDFVDDVDPELSLRGRVANVVPQLANLFNAVVARAVDLQNVKAVAARDFLAAITDTAR